MHPQGQTLDITPRPDDSITLDTSNTDSKNLVAVSLGVSHDSPREVSMKPINQPPTGIQRTVFRQQFIVVPVMQHNDKPTHMPSTCLAAATTVDHLARTNTSMQLPHASESATSTTTTAQPCSIQYTPAPQPPHFATQSQLARYMTQPHLPTQQLPHPNPQYTSQPLQTQYAAQPLQTQYTAQPLQTQYAAQPLPTQYTAQPPQTQYVMQPPNSTTDHLHHVYAVHPHYGAPHQHAHSSNQMAVMLPPQFSHKAPSTISDHKSNQLRGQVLVPSINMTFGTLANQPRTHIPPPLVPQPSDASFAGTKSQSACGVEIDFSPTTWHQSYVRTRHKNLRCFPCCSPIHKESSFCGVTIDVAVTPSSTELADFIFIGKLQKEKDPPFIRVGGPIPFQLHELCEAKQLVIGKPKKSESEGQRYLQFEPPRRWKYDCKLAKHTTTQRHMFSVYVCDKSSRSCLKIVSSPSFQIKSAWKQNCETVSRPSTETTKLEPKGIASTDRDNNLAIPHMSGSAANRPKTESGPMLSVQSQDGTSSSQEHGGTETGPVPPAPPSAIPCQSSHDDPSSKRSATTKPPDTPLRPLKVQISGAGGGCYPMYMNPNPALQHPSQFVCPPKPGGFMSSYAAGQLPQPPFQPGYMQCAPTRSAPTGQAVKQEQPTAEEN